LSFRQQQGKEHAEGVGVAPLFVSRHRITDRERGRCSCRAFDLSVNATAPHEEAQKMRNLILKDFPREVDYIIEQPRQFPVRIETEQQRGTHTIEVVGALHGELKPLASLEVLAPLDDLASRLAGRGIPAGLLTLGKLGTAHQLYIPWMQASYVMVANRKALAYLPAGTDVNTLSYDELATWASTLQQKTGKRLLGFPAGPHADREAS
jgi:multiple sugar transport system substrate-binding protein